MKKIAFCGDSFFSIDHLKPNTHFSELISKKNNLELINNSVPGSSNTYISFQIFDILKNHTDVDLVVVGITSSDRFDTVSKKFNKKINFNQVVNYYKNKEIISNTYSHVTNKDFNRPDIFSNRNDLKNFQEAASKYFKEIYNEQLSLYQDVMILISSLIFLKNKNIDFVCINHFNQNKKHIEIFFSMAGINVNDFNLIEYFYQYQDNNSINHINDHGQIKLANSIIDIINKKLNKNLQKIQ